MSFFSFVFIVKYKPLHVVLVGQESTTAQNTFPKFTHSVGNVDVNVFNEARCPTPRKYTFSSFGKFLLACGVVFFLLALFLTFFSGDVLERIIKKELQLTNSSKSHQIWLENPIPLYVDFYFFNWTNPSNMKQPGYKPQFEEVGPYRFREHVQKVNIQWNINGTVTYKKLRKWYFNQKGSQGTLDDNITTLNVIALTAARSTRQWNRVARVPLAVTLSTTQKMDVTRKVGQFLFDGFPDPLIDFASKVPGLSSQVPFDRFGWFYKRNGSSEFDGVFNMETGANGADVLGKLRYWNYGNRTSFYEDHCGDVVGSAGEFWPPERPKKDDIILFSPDMCRYMNFIYTKEENLGRLKGFRYDSGSSLFDNGTSEPRNRCFCGGECVPSGTLNVSSCRSGAPAFVSYPHFHLADPSYLRAVGGLDPRPGRHDTYIVLDQKWGIPLEVAIRLQINVLVEADAGVRMYKDVPRVFFPMIWFEQKVTMPESLRSEIEFLLDLPRVMWISSIVLHVAGFFSLLPFLFSTLVKKKDLCE